MIACKSCLLTCLEDKLLALKQKKMFTDKTQKYCISRNENERNEKSYIAVSTNFSKNEVRSITMPLQN